MSLIHFSNKKRPPLAGATLSTRTQSLHWLIVYKPLGNSQWQIRVDIYFRILSQGPCPPRRLNQLAFDQTQLNCLQSLIIKRIKVEPKSASFYGLHLKFPVKLVDVSA